MKECNEKVRTQHAVVVVAAIVVLPFPFRSSILDDLGGLFRNLTTNSLVLGFTRLLSPLLTQAELAALARKAQASYSTGCSLAASKLTR